MVGAELNAELERQSALRAGQIQGDETGARVPGIGRTGAVLATARMDGAGQARGGDGSPAGAREWARRMRELRDEGGDTAAQQGAQTLR